MISAVQPAGPTLTARTGRTGRLLVLGLFFILIYALANHLTSLRSDIGHGVFDWERATPFVPWSIVPYLSLVGFFVASFFVGDDRGELDRHVLRLVLALAISVTCYALFPLRFAFQRPQTEGLPGLLFGMLSAFDLPYNRAPSLHISVSLILWVRFAGVTRGLLRGALGLWFGLIGLSVFTTYQHHLIDVLAGGAVGLACLGLARRREAVSPAPAGASTPWAADPSRRAALAGENTP